MSKKATKQHATSKPAPAAKKAGKAAKPAVELIKGTVSRIHKDLDIVYIKEAEGRYFAFSLTHLKDYAGQSPKELGLSLGAEVEYSRAAEGNVLQVTKPGSGQLYDQPLPSWRV